MSKQIQRARTHRAELTIAAGVAAGALAAAAFVNNQNAKQAEQDNPPLGSFLDVNGVRVHYVERGKGTPLVLLHGNGATIEDFECSGLLDEAAKSYRVIAFDRPGHGHTERPRNVVWSAAAQAELIHAALEQLGAAPAIVFGHSWGTTVAIALALEYPQAVQSLVLASGYYYPTARMDVPALSVPAIPIVGDVVRYTVSPILGRLTWGLVAQKLFAPSRVPKAFARFPSSMSLRPSQIRASAAETALMVPQAATMQHRYGELTMPVSIIAGSGDKIVDTKTQSRQLHGELAASTLTEIAGTGHMVHYTARDRVMAAIDKAAAAPHERPRLAAVN